MSDNNTKTIRFSFQGWLPLLGVILITLKLLHVINWPWLLTLAPFWPLMLCVGVILAAISLCGVLGAALGIGACIWGMADALTSARKKKTPPAPKPWG